MNDRNRISPIVTPPKQQQQPTANGIPVMTYSLPTHAVVEGIAALVIGGEKLPGNPGPGIMHAVRTLRTGCELGQRRPVMLFVSHGRVRMLSLDPKSMYYTISEAEYIEADTMDEDEKETEDQPTNGHTGPRRIIDPEA